MPIVATPDNPSSGGLYANEHDLDDLRGIDNITSWSDLENVKVRNSNRILKALAKTDADIEKHLKRRYTFPLTGLSNTDKMILRYWSAVLASYHLYIHRGAAKAAADPNPMMRSTTVYDAEKKMVMDDIWAYKHGIRTFDITYKTSTPIALGGRSSPVLCLIPQSWIVLP